MGACPRVGAIGRARRRRRSGCAPASAPTTSASPGTPEAATAAVEDGETRSLTATLDGDRLTVTLGGLRTEYRVAAADGQIWLAGRATVLAVLEEVREAPVRPDDEHSGDAELVSPMPGAVVAVSVDDGARWPPAPSSSRSRR